MKKVFCFLSVLALSGCITSKDFTPYKDSNGIIRSEYKISTSNLAVSLPEAAVRQDDGKLETSLESARTTLDRQDPYDLREFLEGHNCNFDVLYRSNLKQKSALQKIKEGNFASARDDLKAAKAICKKIEWISLQYYFEAKVAQGLGESDNAKVQTQKFLDYASAFEPRGFYTFDYMKDEFQLLGGNPDIETELAFYRKNAKKFIDGESSELPLSEMDLKPRVAMMYPSNPFRPGGSDSELELVLPVFGFSSVTGSIFGVSLYKSWGRVSLFPSYSYSTLAESMYGLTAKYVLYESENRDTNLDVKVFSGNWKELTYARSNYGPISDVKIVREGFNYGGGFGATRRFYFPSLGLSTEIIGEQNTLMKKFNTYGSLYGFYDVFKGMDIFAGWLHNRRTVGVSILFVRIGYDVDERTIVTYLNGLVF